MQVFVASTRKAEHGAASQALSSDGVHYALDILTIPPGHHAGSIEEPMFGAANARDHIVLAHERTLDSDEFKSELASHVSGRIGVNRDVLVFVHGFNTPFDEARDRTAQIVADSRFGGVAVLFTWPTKHELFGYVSDKDNATASRDALQSLLQEISATPGVGKVHVLAHSMGGWLAMEALRQEAIAGDRDLSGHLGDVMLASPDIDMDVFAGQMARLRPANVTVFATANDRALVALQRHRPVASAGRRDQPVEARGPRAARGARRQGLRPHQFLRRLHRPRRLRRRARRAARDRRADGDAAAAGRQHDVEHRRQRLHRSVGAGDPRRRSDARGDAGSGRGGGRDAAPGGDACPRCDAAGRAPLPTPAPTPTAAAN